MIADQAEALRGLVARQGRPGGALAKTVAVTSGKGGVGKTTLGVNLAAVLSRMGRRVVLIDADLGTANADVLCNVPPGTNLAHVVAGRKTLAEALVRAPGGFGLIRGASGLAQMAALGEYERSRLIEQMGALEADADLMLIDTAAGVGPNVLGFVVAADVMLVVTTPEPTAITDAYAVIKTAARQRGDLDVRLLVNMAGDEAEGRAVFERIAAVCRRFLELTPRYAGCVLRDPRVALSVRERRPFVLGSPGCPASACLHRLAHRLDRHASDPRAQGLLHRMTHWLTG